MVVPATPSTAAAARKAPVSSARQLNDTEVRTAIIAA